MPKFRGLSVLAMRVFYRTTICRGKSMRRIAVMRKVPAVILGDTRSILRLGPAAIKNRAAWTQMDSDILAHFLQVESQIAKSRWCKAKLSMTTQGDKLLDSSFPDFEDFVYAAMYFRQFMLPK